MKRILIEEAGQAAVEYILLLVVVVAVLLGSVYQFNTAFSSWADSYFGDYLACLIESGELPALGSTGESSSGECSQLYKPFSLANGRPLVGSGIGTGSTQDPISKRGDEGGDDSDAPSGQAGVVVSGGGRDSSFSKFGRAKRFRASKRFSSGEGSGEKEGGNTGTGGVTNLSGYENGKMIRIPVATAEQIRNGRRVSEEDKERKLSTKIDPSKEKKTQVNRPPRLKVDRRIASKTEGPEIEEFTFGKLIRYLLMAIIILLVILFVGGQAMQVSKSME